MASAAKAEIAAMLDENFSRVSEAAGIHTVDGERRDERRRRRR
jgi:hypothetical protein